LPPETAYTTANSQETLTVVIRSGIEFHTIREEEERRRRKKKKRRRGREEE